MISKIIVPLDGSQLAEVALPYAEENAGRLNAEMILLIVRQPNDTRSQYMLECYLDKLADIAKNGVAKYKDPGAKPVILSTKVLSGDPAEEIVSFAEREDGSKIVMATHGQSGLTRWAIGSVADKVIRTTNRPVSIIRAQGGKPAVHEKGYLGKILAPVDGSKASEAILPYLEEFAAAMKAEVTFLYSLEMDANSVFNLTSLAEVKDFKNKMKDYMEKLTNSFRQKGIKANYEIIQGSADIAGEINRYTKEHYMDTMVMATHGRSGPRRWVLGSVTMKVLVEGNTPLTLIRSV